MSDNHELARLREWSAELAATSASPWEPRCVAGTFTRRSPDALVFTMQSWIDLEAVRSPLLQGELPEADEEMVFLDACKAFALDLPAPEATSPEAALTILEGMIAEIAAAFGMVLRLRKPGTSESTGANGIGNFLPVLACLVAQLGMSRSDALATPVAQALALCAGHRVNMGWEIAGARYRDREQEGVIDG